MMRNDRGIDDPFSEMEDMPGDPIGLGVIGAGVIFEEHGAAAASLAPKLRLVGVAERDAERLARAGIKHFIPIATRDYQDLLSRTDVDIVAVCTPPSTHEEIVTAALAAGKYVVCEKPLAHTLAAARRIASMAAEYPGRLSVVYQLRFTPEAERIIWLRDAGHLGDLRFANMTRFGALSKNAPTWWGQWSIAGGGVAITQLIHELDLLCHVLGRPVHVEADMATYKAAIESEDTISATIRFENGAMASCASTMAGYKWQQAWDVFGTKGSAHYPWAFHTEASDVWDRIHHEAVRRFPDKGGGGGKGGKGLRQTLIRRLRKAAGRPEKRSSGKGLLHAAYYCCVVDAMVGRGRMPVPPDQALWSQELCAGLYASALTGAAVELPMDRGSPYCEEIGARDHTPA